MAYKKKFIRLVEAEMKKYVAPQTGYYVTVKDNWESSEWAKKQAPSLAIKNLQGLIATKARLRIIEIDTIESIDGKRGYSKDPGVMCTVIGEIATGRYMNDNTVEMPIALLDLIDDIYPNLAPIPDHWKMKTRVNIKPVPVGSDEDEEDLMSPQRTRMTDRGDGKDTPTEIKLAGESTISESYMNELKKY